MKLTTLAALAIITAAAANVASATTVYNNLPVTTPGTPIGVPSFGYQANQIAEMGDKITLAGTDRKLQSVTVGMADWSTLSQYPTFAGNTVNGLTPGFTMPVTINIYQPDADFVDTDGTVYGTVADGAPLATKTINAFIPYKPETYTATTGFNGYYFTLSVDMSDLNLTLPDTFVATLGFNAQTTGVNPTGIAGPYNSLNFGTTDLASAIGTNVNPGDIYFGLMDGGTAYPPFGYGGYGTTTPLFQVNAVPEPTTLAALAGMSVLGLRRRRA